MITKTIPMMRKIAIFDLVTECPPTSGAPSLPLALRVGKVGVGVASIEALFGLPWVTAEPWMIAEATVCC